MVAMIHDSEYENTIATARPAMNEKKLVWYRNPIRNPIATIRPMTNPFLITSEKVLPASTAERAMGNDLNRSITPLERSSVRPRAVCPAPKAATWMRRPGNNQLMYSPWAIGGMAPPIAPPNT